MNSTGFHLNITSEKPEALFAFYRDIVGLPERHDMGEATLDMAGAALSFDGHSAVRGRAQEPARMLLDFHVDDLAAEQERLLAAGVPCLRKEGTEYWGGLISTFEDPDGNYFQLIQYRPEMAEDRAAS